MLREINRHSKTFFKYFGSVLILAAIFWALPADAQSYGSGEPKQFQQRFSIGGRINGAIIIIGWPADEKSIEQLANTVISEAERVYNLLNVSNPSGEVSRINSQAGAGPVTVSWQILDAFKKARTVAQWTKGAFDIVASNGNYDDIEIDEKASTVSLKNSGMRVGFDNMIEGYLADYMINMIYTAKMNNAMVKAGNVFRGIGQSLYGPWKIQVQEDSAAYARHALNLTVSNTGIATISATQFRSYPLIDYRSKNAINPRCKGTTIVMNEAALAQGMAYAVFVFGPQNGIEFLNKFGKARGLIVDGNGQFLKTKGM